MDLPLGWDRMCGRVEPAAPDAPVSKRSSRIRKSTRAWGKPVARADRWPSDRSVQTVTAALSRTDRRLTEGVMQEFGQHRQGVKYR